jgi:hypothetical protein
MTFPCFGLEDTDPADALANFVLCKVMSRIQILLAVGDDVISYARHHIVEIIIISFICSLYFVDILYLHVLFYDYIMFTIFFFKIMTRFYGYFLFFTTCQV